jgi:hypothetical protein
MPSLFSHLETSQFPEISREPGTNRFSLPLLTSFFHAHGLGRHPPGARFNSTIPVKLSAVSSPQNGSRFTDWNSELCREL